jgi:hypothetical protein
MSIVIVEYQRYRNMEYKSRNLRDLDGGGFWICCSRWNRLGTSVILGFRLKMDENCVFLCYYAAISDDSLPTFRDNLSVPSSSVRNSNRGLLTLEDGTDRLF